MVTRLTPTARTQAHGDEAEMDDAALRVLRQFRIVFNAVKNHFQQVEKQAGVGGAQLWALSVIRDKPGCGISELARAMDIHQSTASNLVRALTARGLVSADRDARDRRAVCLSLAPAARRLLLRAPGPFAGVLPSALAQLDRSTLRRLDKDLTELITALNVDDHAANIPLGQ